jgi:Fe2+ transport system protein FeoA
LRTILKISLDGKTMTHLSPAAAAARSVPLCEMKKRARGVVVGLATDAATSERLAALGLGLGAAFEVMQAGRSATVRVGESRIGLGPDLAGVVRAVPR